MNPRLRPILLTVCLAAFACAGSSSSEEHEHPSVVVTQWNDSTELFLEYPHLLAGQATGNWAIHLSDMETFKPIISGTLAVRFLDAGREVAAWTVEAPARDGIYLLDPVVEAPGAYEVRLELDSPQARSVHTLPEVRVFPDPAALPEAEGESGGIAFLKEQQWKISFAVTPAREMDVEQTVSAPARIVARDDGLVEVRAPSDGIALAAHNRQAPSAGQDVTAGQTVAVLSPTAEDGGYARARGELERLEREVERSERLLAAGAIPERRLDEARHALEIARAEIDAMGGGMGDGFLLRLRAPISGVVGERSFVPGGRVAAGDHLFTIVDARRVWLAASVPADVASGLRRSSRAHFRIEGSDRVLLSDELLVVGSVIDERTRTVDAVFTVDNSNRSLKVGQLAQAFVPVGGTVRGVAIPNEAILDEDGIPVAYVQVGGESFERRILTLGASDGSLTHVSEGILPGEMIVTRGAYQIRLASLSGESFSGGHAH